MPKVKAPTVPAIEVKKRKIEVEPEQSLDSFFDDKTNKIILLKYRLDQVLVWHGEKATKPIPNEEPLVLNFGDKNFYFYQSGIREGKISHSYKWLNSRVVKFRTQLSLDQQEQIIEAFTNKIDQDNLKYNLMLLSLKVDFLDNKYRDAIKDLTKEKKILSQEILNFNHKLKSKHKRINFLKKKFEEEFDLKKAVEQIPVAVNFVNPSTSQNVNLQFEVAQTKPKPFLYWEKFKENIVLENAYLDYLGQELKLLSNKIAIQKNNFGPRNELLDLKFNRRGTQAVILNYCPGDSLVWWGLGRKNYFNPETPLVLNINDKDFYFYSGTIKKGMQQIHNKWISYQLQLNYHQQEKIFEKYAETIDQGDLNQQGLLLKLKTHYLITAARALENLEAANFDRETKKRIPIIDKEVQILNNDLEFLNMMKEIKAKNITEKQQELQRKTEVLAKEIDDLHKTYASAFLMVEETKKPIVDVDQQPKFWKKVLLANFENEKLSDANRSSVASTSCSQPMIDEKINFELKEDELEPEVITLE
ncbi:MAG: hypothetical protein REH79_02600 [Spiroplasma sp.]|nr:hypothetical protein [Spiroplasma sp.]